MSTDLESVPKSNGIQSENVEVHSVGSSNIILHVLVIGFHHKKGSQIEYSYPPLSSGSQCEVPEEWKYLTSLSIPDGAHHHQSDTIYFHLPPKNADIKHNVIYGVSCYRQIKAQNVKNPSADITRSSVQKAVCVLSTLPLFGHIEVHVSEVAKHFMEKGDLNDYSEFPYLYRNLNANLSNKLIKSKELYLGLSLTQLVWTFRHKILVLFKLFLLEKKVLFYSSKVASLCSTILSILSLFPLELDEGLSHSVSIYKGDNINEPTLSLHSDMNNDDDEPSNFIFSKENCDNNDLYNDLNSASDTNDSVIDQEPTSCDSNVSRQVFDTKEILKLPPNINDEIDFKMLGFPLKIFSSGCLCHPYLSLHYLETLNNEDVRGYVIGASNILFKQKKHLSDVLIEVEDCKVEVQNQELRRVLNLSTEDLRFAEYIVKNITQNLIEGPERETWVRRHFQYYLLMLFRTSLSDDSMVDNNYYNASFISAWKSTSNYKRWKSKHITEIRNFPLGHPCAGQLSVSDMKLRISHSMQSSDRGRKINQTIAATGKAVALTGKAVGGALSQARGAFSSWWSNFSVAPEGAIDAMETVPDDNNDEIDIAETIASVIP